MKDKNLMRIQVADSNDHLALSRITKMSKAHWGYNQTQMQLWDDELTVTVKDFDRMHFYKLVQNNCIIGYYAYEEQAAMVIKLDSLFILPEFIGFGLGKFLLMDMFNRLQNTGFKKILLEADPHAEPFYLKQGFSVIGQKKTSIENRYLPIMEKYIG